MGDDRPVPHYWFRVPLSGTAPHLKEAKRRGGAPAVKQEMKKDAAKRGKEVEVTFAPDLSYCLAAVFSAVPMTQEDIAWFKQRWDVQGDDDGGGEETTLSADESVLEESSGWNFSGGGETEY